LGSGNSSSKKTLNLDLLLSSCEALEFDDFGVDLGLVYSAILSSTKELPSDDKPILSLCKRYFGLV